jgi:hypothetical protein
MARINTTKTLSNDGYFSSVDNGGDFGPQQMTVSPVVSDQYDYALTEDIVLLNERKDTAEKLYEIWIHSPFYEQYSGIQDPSAPPTKTTPKIPKEEISKIFYYVKNKLQEQKKLTMYEMVIAINEFFEFNYDFIVKKVLSPKIKAEILEDYYNNGMKQRMDMNIAEKLF